MLNADQTDAPEIPADPNPADCLAKIAASLKAAAREGGRDHEITITAVSKKHKATKITPVLQAGHRVFGENRVQEALEKWPSLKETYEGIELHLIGPLQSNKAREAVALFDVIETVDRVKIARALAQEIANQGRSPKLLVQINTGQELQKSGIAPAQADGFIDQCKTEFGLAIAGLMCIPPADEPPAPHFALLEKIARRNGLKSISMGMSADYEIAAQLGATHVRIGSAIFGPRL